jgi:host factor-I protein
MKPNAQSPDLDNVLELSFIQSLVDEQTPVSVFLRSGLQLKGTIAELADNCIILSNGGQQQLIFKHIISTICPH